MKSKLSRVIRSLLQILIQIPVKIFVLASKTWQSSLVSAKVAPCAPLELLRSEGMSDLPKDPHSLLSTPRTVHVDEVSDGQYYHFGLLKVLKDHIDNNGTHVNILYINV